MSVILITEHDENIYNVIKKATTYHKKSPRYRSMFRDRINCEQKYNKSIKSHATMGLAREPLPKPTDYLKKRSWKPAPLFKVPPECDSDYGKPRCLKQEKFPDIPCTSRVLKEQDERLKSKQQKKNFVVENIKKALCSKPKVPAKKVVIERYGETKELSRGLEPQYIYSAAFGKTPAYLQRLIKHNERNLQKMKDRFGIEQPKCRYITREERENLLTGLKQNWEELQKQYQGLPILTDTIPKINRKSKMEADLKQLEKDIVLIERHPYIYVYDDDELTN